MKIQLQGKLPNGLVELSLWGAPLPARARYLLRLGQPVPADWTGQKIQIGAEVGAFVSVVVTRDGEMVEGVWGVGRSVGLAGGRWWWSRAKISAPLERARCALIGLDDHVCAIDLPEVFRLRSQGLHRPEVAARVGLTEQNLVDELAAHLIRWSEPRGRTTVLIV